jgi:hypothetical protein
MFQGLQNITNISENHGHNTFTFCKGEGVISQALYCCNSDYVSVREFSFLVTLWVHFSLTANWEDIILDEDLFTYFDSKCLKYILWNHDPIFPWNFGTIYLYLYCADFEFDIHRGSTIGSTRVIRYLTKIEMRYILIWITFKVLATGIKNRALLTLLLSVLA